MNGDDAGNRDGESDEPARRDGDGDSNGGGGGDLLERAVVVAGVLLLVGALGFIAWQASVTTTAGVPTASVESVEPLSDGDRQRVTVRLDNDDANGLSSVQVGVRCGDVSRSVEFDHVPAGGRRTAAVVCPVGTTPESGVETWIEA